MSEPLIVELGARAYPIHIGHGIAGRIADEVACLRAAGRALAVVTDRHVNDAQAAFLDHVFAGVPRLVLAAGETTKSFDHLRDVCDFLAAHRIDRNGALFAVGGGVIGDLAGFAAAVFLRGIDFYQVPTSLLAMVDSSVGGKTGINIAAGKNLVGAFHQPQAVFADAAVLETLPAREFSAGMAEVIKHGMLADAALFARLEALDGALHPRHPDMAAVLRRNCEIKAGVVKADEREQAASGGRALLNLGHTFGHAIEAVAGYGTYLHGEAIAVGLVLATALSERLGWVDMEAVARVERLLERYDLPVRLRAPLPLDDLLAAMTRDKKVRSGRMRFVALRAIGEAVTTDAVDPEWVRELWLDAGARE